MASNPSTAHRPHPQFHDVCEELNPPLGMSTCENLAALDRSSLPKRRKASLERSRIDLKLDWGLTGASGAVASGDMPSCVFCF